MNRFFSLSAVLILLGVSSCQAGAAGELSLGDPESCSGVTVVVNFGILSEDSLKQCVVVGGGPAVAHEILSVAGVTTEGTITYGDQVVCRVNGLPSESEAFTVEGEQPHTETCADMAPAFAYWALWVKQSAEADWAYAEEGVGTLELVAGDTIGLAFSTGGETPVPETE